LEDLVIWDDEDDPNGNLAHIAKHGVTRQEVEDVLSEPENDRVFSHSSGRLITFGWTGSGRHIAVVWDEVGECPTRAYPVTAYETPPPVRV
jgi:uncharacterized DUF497 family protein